LVSGKRAMSVGSLLSGTPAITTEMWTDGVCWDGVAGMENNGVAGVESDDVCFLWLVR
jgi:hypothetical protein